jgi:hypothetical protein
MAFQHLDGDYLIDLTQSDNIITNSPKKCDDFIDLITPEPSKPTRAVGVNPSQSLQPKSLFHTVMEKTSQPSFNRHVNQCGSKNKTIIPLDDDTVTESNENSNPGFSQGLSIFALLNIEEKQQPIRSKLPAPMLSPSVATQAKRKREDCIIEKGCDMSCFNMLESSIDLNEDSCSSSSCFSLSISSVPQTTENVHSQIIAKTTSQPSLTLHQKTNHERPNPSQVSVSPVSRTVVQSTLDTYLQLPIPMMSPTAFEVALLIDKRERYHDQILSNLMAWGIPAALATLAVSSPSSRA